MSKRVQPGRSSDSRAARSSKSKSGKRLTTRQRLRRLRAKPTIGGMREQLSSVLSVGLWVFVAIFLITGIWAFSEPAAPAEGEEAESRSLPNPVMRVGRSELALPEWQQMLSRMGLNDSRALPAKFQQQGYMADAWVRQQVELELARQRGLNISRSELNAEIDSQIDQALAAERGGLSDRQWEYKLQRDQGGLAKKQADLRSQLTADAAALRESLLVQKLRTVVQDELTLTDADYAKELEQIGGRVILLRSGASKPAPAGEGEVETPEQQTQRAEAEKAWREGLDRRKDEAEKLLAQLQAAPTTFAAVAEEKSEDYATKDNGGQMALASRDQTYYGDDFKEKAFATKPGAFAPLIEGNDGWIIFMAKERKAFPDDFKKPEPRDFAAAEGIAADLVKKLKGGADFAQVARDESDDPGSGAQGGDLGWVTRGQMVAPFEKMAFAMPQGEISPPFRSQFGVHILEVTERELPGPGETAPAEAETPEPDPADKRAVAEAEALKVLPLPEKPAAPAMRVKVRHILISAEDPERKIEDLKQQVLDRKRSAHYEDVVRVARQEAKNSGRIQILDPELRAFFDANDGDSGAEMASLRATVAQWPTIRPEANLELARRYEQAQMSQAMGPEAEKDQLAAVAALASDQEAIPGLIEALDSPLPAVKIAIANALGEMKAAAATERLSELVREDYDQTVADAAKAALTKLGAPIPERHIGGTPATPAGAPAAGGAAAGGQPAPITVPVPGPAPN